jgi:hypothetical protein
MLTWSCSHFERTRECRALTDLVNLELDAIEATMKTAKRDAATFDSISRKYAALAGQLAKLRMTDPELSASLVEYGKTFQEASVSVRALADALRAQDLSRIEKERHALDLLSRRQRMQSVHVAAQCRS